MPVEGFVPMPGADAWQLGSSEAATPAAEAPADACAAAPCTHAAPVAMPGAGAPEQLDRLPSNALHVAHGRVHALHAHACSNSGSRRTEAAAAAAAEVVPDTGSHVPQSEAQPCGGGGALFAGARAAAAGASEARDAGADLAAGPGELASGGLAQPSGTASRGGCTPHGSPASGSSGEPGERDAPAAHGRAPAHDTPQPGPSAGLGKPGAQGAQNEPGGAQLLSTNQTSGARAPRRETTGLLLPDWGSQPAHAHLRFDSESESGPDPGPDPDPGPAAGILEGLCSGANLGLRPSDAADAMAAVAAGGDALAVAAGGDALDMAARDADALEPAEGVAAADAALAAIAAVAEDVAAAEATMRAGRDAPAVAAAQAVGARRVPLEPSLRA